MLRSSGWLAFLLLIGGWIASGCALSQVSSPTADYPATATFPVGTSEAVLSEGYLLPSLTPPAPLPLPGATPSSVPVSSDDPETPMPTLALGRFVIGSSIEGRPLEVWRFGWGPIQRMIVAGIHGGYEWNTVALAGELIVYLEDHPEAVPADKTLFILKDLNPDGEARVHGPDGRVNANGVDLNRNFPVFWESNWPQSGCWQERSLSSGLGPASEPETQALMAFVQSHPISGLISYHSAGLGLFPGEYKSGTASVSLAETLAKVSKYPYPPVDTGCIFTGQLIDWASAQGIAAVDIELNNHRDTDFQVNLAVLSAFLDWEP